MFCKIITDAKQCQNLFERMKTPATTVTVLCHHDLRQRNCDTVCHLLLWKTKENWTKEGKICLMNRFSPGLIFFNEHHRRCCLQTSVELQFKAQHMLLYIVLCVLKNRAPSYKFRGLSAERWTKLCIFYRRNTRRLVKPLGCSSLRKATH